MAAIFLVIAILIVAVRELGIAYKAHEAAKQEEEEKNWFYSDKRYRKSKRKYREKSIWDIR